MKILLMSLLILISFISIAADVEGTGVTPSSDKSKPQLVCKQVSAEKIICFVVIKGDS